MARSFRHWTWAYTRARFRWWLYRRIHPGDPWLTPEAIRILASLLKKEDIGLEWGSGRSTLWFGQRIQSLTTVEHNPKWHQWVEEQVEKHGHTNVRCLLRDLAPENGERSPYVQVAESIDDSTLSFCLVDGRLRAHCANAVIPKLRPNAVLVVDDAQRYLPSPSRSPAARREEDGPASEPWARFLETVRSWRCIWTSNGKSDTVIWIKTT